MSFLYSLNNICLLFCLACLFDISHSDLREVILYSRLQLLFGGRNQFIGDPTFYQENYEDNLFLFVCLFNFCFVFVF